MATAKHKQGKKPVGRIAERTSFSKQPARHGSTARGSSAQRARSATQRRQEPSGLGRVLRALRMA